MGGVRVAAAAKNKKEWKRERKRRRQPTRQKGRTHRDRGCGVWGVGRKRYRIGTFAFSPSFIFHVYFGEGNGERSGGWEEGRGGRGFTVSVLFFPKLRESIGWIENQSLGALLPLYLKPENGEKSKCSIIAAQAAAIQSDARWQRPFKYKTVKWRESNRIITIFKRIGMGSLASCSLSSSNIYLVCYFVGFWEWIVTEMGSGDQFGNPKRSRGWNGGVEWDVRIPWSF